MHYYVQPWHCISQMHLFPMYMHLPPIFFRHKQHTSARNMNALNVVCTRGCFHHPNNMFVTNLIILVPHYLSTCSWVGLTQQHIAVLSAQQGDLAHLHDRGRASRLTCYAQRRVYDLLRTAFKVSPSYWHFLKANVCYEHVFVHHSDSSNTIWCHSYSQNGYLK
jgi:hypothetical protein